MHARGTNDRPELGLGKWEEGVVRKGERRGKERRENGKTKKCSRQTRQTDRQRYRQSE